MVSPVTFFQNDDYFTSGDVSEVLSEVVPSSPGLLLHEEEEFPLQLDRFRDDTLFYARWSLGNEPQRNNSVGVGYISSSSTAYHEALEDGFYLSRILGGPLVTGICSKGRLCGNKDLSLSVEVSMLLASWKKFFQDKPRGKYIQYFFKDGGQFVAYALEKSQHRDRITTVGLNSNTVLTGKHTYMFRSLGDCSSFFSRNHQAIMALVWLSNSSSLCFPRFNDPVFTCALQLTYYVLAYPGSALALEDIVKEARLFLQLIHTVQRQKMLNARCFGVARDSNQPQKVSDVVNTLITNCTIAFDGEERWPERRLDCFFISLYKAMHIQDYVLAFFLSEHINDRKITATMSVFAIYWTLVAVAKVMLYAHRKPDMESSVQFVALVVGSASGVFSAIDACFNFHLAGCGSGIHGVLALHAAAASARGIMTLFPRVRELTHSIPRAVLGNREETTIVVVNGDNRKVAKVRKQFIKDLVQERIFAHLFILMVCGSLAFSLKWLRCLGEKWPSLNHFHQHTVNMGTKVSCNETISSAVGTYEITRGAFVMIATVALIYILLKSRCCRERTDL